MAYTKGSRRAVFIAFLYEKQGGQCAICRVELQSENMHLDHNHETGFVRGLLCRRCNTGIGQFQDDAGLLRRASHYLDVTNQVLSKMIQEAIDVIEDGRVL